MFRIFFTIVVLVIVLLSGCITHQRTSSIDRGLYDLIEQTYNSPYEQSLNSAGSMLLIWKPDEGSGIMITKYTVWNTETRGKEYSGSFRGKNIQWLDDSHLLLTDEPGIVDQNNMNFKYKIDVINKTKTQYTDAFKH